MDEILSFDHVHMEYSTKRAKLVSVGDVSFKVRRNEFVTLIGPSGCGKSTLINMVLGLVKPTSGSVLVGGVPVEQHNSKIAVVFQNAALFPWLDIQKNVEVVLEPLIKNQKERTETALKFMKMVGIDGFENAYPKELSGGMKQRVSIARALATSPDLLILDEPFVGLDVFSAQALREELLDLWESEDTPPHTVLMVTHNVDEAVQLSDRLVVLSKRPSHVIQDMEVGLERPRNTREEAFYSKVDEVVSVMSP
ncbi:MAG: ABC transporter ATP-binding protein [Candidatus Thermoplasmatota archaeon]|nr:ABC transporter ATP-binding protein [Candidatus Thermoplasmatota archaeon]